jgi:hypothetical protein
MGNDYKKYYDLNQKLAILENERQKIVNELRELIIKIEKQKKEDKSE